jgi:hypothetical protein
MKIGLIKKLMAITIVTTTILGTTCIGASAEWKQNSDNTWSYNNNSNDLKNQWMYEKSSGKNYYFDNNGIMKSNSWINSNGNWYYLGGDGALVKNTTINGYQVNNDGVWIGGNVTTTTNVNSNNITNINNGVINNTSVTNNYLTKDTNMQNPNFNNEKLPIVMPSNWTKIDNNYAINNRSILIYGVKDTFGVNQDDILLGIKENLILKSGYNVTEKTYNGYKSNCFEYLDITQNGIQKFYYVVIFNNNKVYGFMMCGNQDNYNADKQELENVLNNTLNFN